MKCLSSVYLFPPACPFEIIVVDNRSSDGSAAATEEQFPSVNLIRSEKNLGYALGNNRAFEEATGDILLTLNPDTQFIDDSLTKCVEFMKSHSDIAALGAKQLNPGHTVQRSIRGFPTFLGVFGDITGFGRLYPGSGFDSYRLNNFDYSKEQIAPQPMGTFLLFRKSMLAKVADVKQPFDSQFPIFFNEVDLLFRMQNEGLKCMYVPSISLLHWGGESTKQTKKIVIWESHLSLIRYWRKHLKGPLNRLILALLIPIIWAGAFIRAKGYSRGFRF